MPEEGRSLADRELQRACNSLSMLAALVIGTALFLFVEPKLSLGLIIAVAALVSVVGGQLAYHGIRYRRRKGS